MDEERKVCSKCGAKKLRSKFYTRKRRSGNGRRQMPHCKICNGKRSYDYRQRKLKEQKIAEVSECQRLFPTLTTVPGTPERISVYRARVNRGAPALCVDDAESRDDPKYIKVHA